MDKFIKRVVYEKDGSIRKRCARTIASKGYWWTLWNNYGYWKLIKSFWITNFYEVFINSIVRVVLYIVFVLTTPISPFICAFNKWNRSVKECIKEDYKKLNNLKENK